MSLQNKLIAVVNNTIPNGVALNALGHLSMALGHKLKTDELLLRSFSDSKQKVLWQVSGLSYIIFKGSSNDIKKTFLQAQAQGIIQLSFSDAMGLWRETEQIYYMADKTIDELVFYATVLYGDEEKIKSITKRLSLFK